MSELDQLYLSLILIIKMKSAQDRREQEKQDAEDAYVDAKKRVSVAMNTSVQKVCA